MDNEKAMQEVTAAIERYFNEPKPDGECNISIIRENIQRYGAVLIPMGFAYIADKLRQIGRSKTVSMSLLYEPRRSSEYIISQGNRLMVCQLSLVTEYGEEGTEVLIKTLGATDEDVAELAAYILAGPQFAYPDPLPHLRSAFQSAYGSAYKLALALAMYTRGDKKQFKNLVFQFLMKPPLWVRLIPFMDDYALAQAAPRIFNTIALDIASDGRAYDGPGEAHWKKKQYND